MGENLAWSWIWLIKVSIFNTFWGKMYCPFMFWPFIVVFLCLSHFHWPEINIHWDCMKRESHFYIQYSLDLHRIVILWLTRDRYPLTWRGNPTITFDSLSWLQFLDRFLWQGDLSKQNFRNWLKREGGLGTLISAEKYLEFENQKIIFGMQNILPNLFGRKDSVRENVVSLFLRM